MSPEQVKAEKVLDGRCDQYSLGCVVFELLTGDKLFEGDQAIQVLLKHVQEAPRDPRLLRMEIPERLSKAILKMVAKTPAERFASMDEVVAEFDWILQNLDNLPKAPRGPALAAP
jgi:serine/threonine-protein kinase